MSNQSSLADLVQEYKEDTFNEYEKAECEERIYLQATREKVRQPGEDRFVFFKRFLGVSKYDTCNRQALFSRGDRVKPLWDRVLRDYLPVTSAVTLARQAQTIAYTEHLEYEVALKRVLDEYDSKPSLSAMRNGKIVKKSAPHRKNSPPPKPVKVKRAAKLAPPASASSRPVRMAEARNSDRTRARLSAMASALAGAWPARAVRSRPPSWTPLRPISAPATGRAGRRPAG